MNPKVNVSREDLDKSYFNKDGSTTYTAAHELGVSRRVITRAIKEFGLKAKNSTRNWHKKCKYPMLKDKAWLAEQMKTKSYHQIARDIGGSDGNVRDHAVRHGLVPNVSENPSENVAAGIRKTFPEGRRGDKSTRWNGGIKHGHSKDPLYSLSEEDKPKSYTTYSGYVWVKNPDHWRANSLGYVLEHYAVMEKFLKRRLEPNEYVKHINKIRNDNRPENLEIKVKTPRREVKVAERTGENAGNWKGGRRQLKSGYVLIFSPDHPMCTISGYVMEHRLVMEQKLGRILYAHEIVHHKDGVKNNNHPDNLELKDNGSHISDHFKDSIEVDSLRKEVADLKEKLRNQTAL